LDNAQTVQSSTAQGKGPHIVLRDNYHGPSRPGGHADKPHWPKAPRDRSESKCVRGIRCVGLARDGSIVQLVSDGVSSCGEVFLDGSFRAKEDMVVECEGAIGIWRGWTLWWLVWKLSRWG
jgi:hypothetical protein